MAKLYEILEIGGLKDMSYETTENRASERIAALLDEGSFVEIGAAVKARTECLCIAGGDR